MTIKLFKRTDVQWNHNTFYTNLWSDNTKFNLTEKDQIALKLRIKYSPGLYSGDDILDAINISFYHSSQFYNERDVKDFKLTELKFEK